MIGSAMASRRPARWLAPLALLASVVAVLAVISANRSLSGSTSTTAPQSVPAGTTKDTTQTTTTTSRQRSGGAGGTRATYRVQSGDTLLSVAQQTGVPIERIRELNPTVDANALHVGQILRLRPASP